MAFLSPPDDKDVVYEFFAPFAHVPGRYEWCRIRSPTHGVFDTFVVLDPVRGPSGAAIVYVSHDWGAKYMKERYPECEAHLVNMGDLRIEERDNGRTVIGDLKARAGPVKTVRMTFTAPGGATPRQVPYGGRGEPVWGSKRFTCWGVDLVLDATVTGVVEKSEGFVEQLNRAPALLTLGSFGRIAPPA
ncbi:MAG TPA: hypothetical protein VM370_00395 [Candidatus Thermoplasmatota archaeon]|nr:hypothetical protein [Candidatus Thermoplasmatota archaeon]